MGALDDIVAACVAKNFSLEQIRQKIGTEPYEMSQTDPAEPVGVPTGPLEHPLGEDARHAVQDEQAAGGNDDRRNRRAERKKSMTRDDRAKHRAARSARAEGDDNTDRAARRSERSKTG